MRVPSPPASTMARRGAMAVWGGAPISILRSESDRLQRRNVLTVPFIERPHRRMRQRALQVGPYAWHVTQILRLAVAQVEAGEDAENLAGALGRERYVGLDEFAAV